MQQKKPALLPITRTKIVVGNGNETKNDDLSNDIGKLELLTRLKLYTPPKWPILGTVGTPSHLGGHLDLGHLYLDVGTYFPLYLHTCIWYHRRATYAGFIVLLEL